MYDSGEMSDSNPVGSDAYRSISSYYSTQGELTVTVLGETKTLAGLDRNEWIFLLLCVPCVLATIGFTFYTLIAKIHPNSHDYVFAILLLINSAFCLFYTIHGVLREREFELYCLIVAILILTVYVIVNFALTYPPSHIKLARFIVIVVLAPVIIGYAWVVGKGFGYLLFKTVGAGAEIQDMYRTASRFSGLLKIDYQLAVILLVLTIEDGENLSYFSKCSLAVGIPFQMLASLVGWIAMRTEQLLLVWCFMPLCCAEPVFIAYRITQFSARWSYYTDDQQKLTYSFIAAAIGAVIIRLLVLIALYLVVKNFGRGLKFRVFQIPPDTNGPPIMPSKRQIKKCCGMVCCGPFG